jgi:hypothetical protein
MLNGRVIPWLEEQDVRILRVLTDRGTEYCGAREQHGYELYLAIEDMDYFRTKARHPLNQWNLRKVSPDYPERILCHSF